MLLAPVAVKTNVVVPTAVDVPVTLKARLLLPVPEVDVAMVNQEAAVLVTDQVKVSEAFVELAVMVVEATL